MPSETDALLCTSCGAPLTPEASAVRVRCTHCGTTSDVGTEGVLRVGRALAKAGVHVSPNPMTMDQIEAEIRERDEAARARQRTALIMVAVALGVLGLVGAFAASR